MWDIDKDGVRKREKDIFTPGVSLRDRLKWLSDGKRLAFAGEKLDRNRQLVKAWFIMNVDGTDLIEISTP